MLILVGNVCVIIVRKVFKQVISFQLTVLSTHLLKVIMLRIAMIMCT